MSSVNSLKRMFLASLLFGSIILVLLYFLLTGDESVIYGRISLDKLSQVFLAVAGSLFASFLVLFSTRSVDDAERQELWSHLKGIETAVSTNETLACKYISQKVPHKLLDGLLGTSGGRKYFTAVGVTLTPLQDYIRRSAKLPGFKIDLVLPYPDDATLGRIAEREGRSIEALRNSILQIKAIIDNGENKADIRLRYSADIPNYTIIRVDEHIVWRPRVASYDGINDQFCFHTDQLTGESLFMCLKRELGSIFDRSKDSSQAFDRTT